MFNTKHELRRAACCLPIAVFCLLFCLPARAAIALVAHTARSDGTTTTAAINTTGATLLVVDLVTRGANPTVSDSQGDTWNYLTYYSVPSHGYLVIAYSYSKSGGALSTSTSHTFTVSGGSYPSIAASAWSGTLTTSAVLDSSTVNGASSSSTASLPTGSTGTLSGVGELVFSGWGSDNPNGYSVSSLTVSGGGLSVLDLPTSDTNDNIADAYCVESSTTAVDATWSWTTSSADFEVAIAGFKPSGVAPPTCPQSVALMGVGCR